MNNPDEAVKLLETYEAAGEASRALRHAALRGDWDEFDRLQERCRDIVGTLRASGPSPKLPAPQARRRHEILVSILADDRAIRDILEPVSSRLGHLLHLGRRPEAAAR